MEGSEQHREEVKLSGAGLAIGARVKVAASVGVDGGVNVVSWKIISSVRQRSTAQSSTEPVCVGT
jgi:hypothetical protein